MGVGVDSYECKSGKLWVVFLVDLLLLFVLYFGCYIFDDKSDIHSFLIRAFS